MNSVEERRQAFEREIDKCKRNVELIFDEYARIVEPYPNQFLTKAGEIEDTRDTFKQLGKTYINLDNLLKTRDDWSNDVIAELETRNHDLRVWIHRRENPDVDLGNAFEILGGSVYRVYDTTENLVGAVKDAETARLSQEA